MAKSLSKLAVKTALIACLSSSIAFAAETSARPTKVYCEENFLEANQAADAAKTSYMAFHGATVGGGTLLACHWVSMAVIYTDGGIGTLLCTGLSALVALSTATEPAAHAARDAFVNARDPRCIPG